MTTSFRHDRISLYLKLVFYAILAVTVLHQKIWATNGGIFLEQEYDTIDLRQLFEIVRRNLLLIVAVTVLFAAGGYLGTTFFITQLVGKTTCGNLFGHSEERYGAGSDN